MFPAKILSGQVWVTPSLGGDGGGWSWGWWGISTSTERGGSSEENCGKVCITSKKDTEQTRVICPYLAALQLGLLLCDVHGFPLFCTASPSDVKNHTYSLCISCQTYHCSFFFFLVFYFLNFKIFISYMRSQTWTPLPLFFEMRKVVGRSFVSNSLWPHEL